MQIDREIVKQALRTLELVITSHDVWLTMNQRAWDYYKVKDVCAETAKSLRDAMEASK